VLKSANFRYIRVDSVGEALSILQTYGSSAKLLAGGQSLLPLMNMRLSNPEVLIDISRIEELRNFNESNGILRIGALVRHCEIENSSLVKKYAPLLSMALPYVAHKSVRTRGTFGGSVALADPASETPAMTLAHEATMIIRSIHGERKVAAQDFFKGLYDTDLNSDEILIGAEFSPPPPNEKQIFREIARRKGDYATVGLGVRANITDGIFQNLRLVYFAVADTPIIASSVMQKLLGEQVNLKNIQIAIDYVAEDVVPNADTYHQADTKMHMLKVLLKRTLLELIQEESAYA
jgi:aerobic carbon-monoxide dehydrogenase medium subunit